MKKNEVNSIIFDYFRCTHLRIYVYVNVCLIVYVYLLRNKSQTQWIFRLNCNSINATVNNLRPVLQEIFRKMVFFSTYLNGGLFAVLLLLEPKIAELSKLSDKYR